MGQALVTAVQVGSYDSAILAGAAAASLWHRLQTR